RRCVSKRRPAGRIYLRTLVKCFGNWRKIVQGVHMKLRFGVIVAAIIINTAAVPGAFAQKMLDEIVARVGSDIILKSELDNEKQAKREDLIQQGMNGAQLEQAFQERSKHVLRDLIDSSLLVQEAKELGISGDLEV